MTGVLSMATSTLLLNVSRGTHWGIPNTTMPYEKFANIEIPRRKWMKYDTAFMIGDAYLTLYPSRVFFLCQACRHQKSTAAFARKK